MNEEKRYQERDYQVPAELREQMKSDIAGKVGRSSAISDLSDIVQMFAGCEGDALSVLYWAAEKGKFDTYLGKLKKQHDKDVQYVPVSRGMRRNLALPAVNRTYDFFMACYKELGVKPQK